MDGPLYPMAAIAHIFEAITGKLFKVALAVKLKGLQSFDLRNYSDTVLWRLDEKRRGKTKR